MKYAELANPLRQRCSGYQGQDRKKVFGGNRKGLLMGLRVYWGGENYSETDCGDVQSTLRPGSLVTLDNDSSWANCCLHKNANHMIICQSLSMVILKQLNPECESIRHVTGVPCKLKICKSTLWQIPSQMPGDFIISHVKLYIIRNYPFQFHIMLSKDSPELCAPLFKREINRIWRPWGGLICSLLSYQLPRGSFHS